MRSIVSNDSRRRTGSDGGTSPRLVGFCKSRKARWASVPFEKLSVSGGHAPRARYLSRALAPCVSAPQPCSELSQTSYLIIHDARMVPTICRYEGHIGVPCVEGRHGRYMNREDGTRGMRKLGAGREVSISWSRGTPAEIKEEAARAQLRMQHRWQPQLTHICQATPASRPSPSGRVPL